MEDTFTIAKRYEVEGEGYSCATNGKDFGMISIVQVEGELYEDGYFEGVEHDKIECVFVSDKYGGELIVNEPDDFYPEFSNGLTDHGQFETLDEAQNAMNELIDGTIDFDKL